MWQIVAFALVAFGGMGDIYNLFGIPWNATGISNVLAVSLGWVIFESPVILALITWWIAAPKKT